MDVPVSGDLMIYNLPVELLGQAVTDVQYLSADEDEDRSLTRDLPFDLSFADGLMGATEVPSFSQVNNLGSVSDLSTVTGTLPLAV